MSWDVNCKRPDANLWVLMCQLSFWQLHMDFISSLNGTYYSISPAGGISSRKCEMGNADKSQIPRGSLEFVQMKCDKGSLKYPSLALCNHMSLEWGGAPGWIGGGMCLWMHVRYLAVTAERGGKSRAGGYPRAAQWRLHSVKSFGTIFPVVSAL